MFVILDRTFMIGIGFCVFASDIVDSGSDFCGSELDLCDFGFDSDELGVRFS